MLRSPLHAMHAWVRTFVFLVVFGSIAMPVYALDVYPGGQTIGIQVNANGVLVTGTYSLKANAPESGDRDPSTEQPFSTGDVILSADGKKVSSIQELRKQIELAGQQKRGMQFTILRQNKQMQLQMKPQWDPNVQQYRLGLYLRDQTSGIGTLSFWIPAKKVYGALGHPITDGASKEPLPVKDGHIFDAKVTGIRKSEKGVPGEKQADWIKDQKPLGTIEKNTQLGIFGTLLQNIPGSEQIKPIPVAKASEIHTGPAQVLTVIQGDQIERFQAEIIQVQTGNLASTKNIVIRITDPRLIQASGGIVQGMSGSPIIQDGKLIGAVTHVFVKQPHIGFACAMEWMLAEAGISLDATESKQSLSGDSLKSPAFSTFKSCLTCRMI